MTTTTTAKPASDRQRSYLTSLLSDKDLTETAYPAYDEGVIANLTSREASNAISDLLKLPRKATATPQPATATRTLADVTTGMWLVDGDVETGRVFKVVPCRESDRHYARELVDGDFVYVKGAMYLIARSGRRMTLDEAKQYGAITGRCCVCGRLLTAEDSVSQGIGPVCASRF